MARDTIEIQLTAAERSLLLRYGYPFDEIERTLQAYAASNAIEIVSLDRIELERLIGDLCHSINHASDGALQDRLLTLCDRLEVAERHGSGMPDLL